MTLARLTAIVALILPAFVCAQSPVPGLDEAAATITGADFARRVGLMAHDSMQGRDTPSPGLEKTASWIAGEFARMGLRGGGADGSYVQRYPLRSVVLDTERSFMTLGTKRLAFEVDLLPLLGDVMNGEVTAPLALVSGSGNEQAGLADNAVRGRHAVLVLPASAGGVDQRVYRTVVALRNAGAVSVLVASPAGDDAWAAGRSLLGAEVSRAWVDPSVTRARTFLPVLQVRASSVAELIRGTGMDLSALQARGNARLRVDEVPQAEATLALRYVEEEVTAPNVMGILEGSDPGLRDEYVVVSAHMDHVGIGVPNEAGDSIYNGADDNASGTSAVVEIAEAMSSLQTPPARSVLFLLVSGEEKGLWGSEYFVTHPPVPVDRMVADLNMDMVGRNWPDTIVAIGKEHSDLGATLERVNRGHPELGMTAIDDLWPQESFYTRSDHFNFARRGVPILFFFNGVHDDYHGPGDEPERIDAEKAARIARLVFYLGAELANDVERPRWRPESYARIVGS